MNEKLRGLKSQAIIYAIAGALSWLMADMKHYYISGVVLICLAFYLYLAIYSETRSLVDFRGLFTLAWIGGMGLACLKLSRLQSDWSPVTWICFLITYICFWFGFEGKLFGRKGSFPDKIAINENAVTRRRLYNCAVGLTIVSTGCFILEACLLKYIPILSDKPHAYSYFHVSGVHYFTVCFIFVPAISLLYLRACRDAGQRPRKSIWLCDIITVLLPILCVSRFQLIFTLLLLLLSYLAMSRKVRLRYVVIIVLCLIPLCVALTFLRHHSVSYLNGVFAMKDPNMPIFLTQPYIYIANNFENFNALVRQLPAFTWGTRELFPFFTLTGLKFKFPELIVSTIYTTKEELTTLTIIYDAYYDFGIPGVAVFSWFLGTCCKWVHNAVGKNQNPIAVLYYAQLAAYLLLAFFTTWFSNPTTWFWLAATTAMYWYVGRRSKTPGDGKNKSE